VRRLSDRVAVITGAASGIGRALAGRFAAEGMRRVLADIDDSALEEAVAELRGSGAAAIGVRTDVSSAADVQVLADAAMDGRAQRAPAGPGALHSFVGVSVLIPGLTRTRIFESMRNLPKDVTAPPPSSFAASSKTAIEGAWDNAMPPQEVADVVTAAIREQRSYVRWMSANGPLEPGPGVARTADARPAPRVP
jgi:NAD(P)-dependent dehydrogenase (short-subunit alcohol dehydrogenase family)